VDPVAGTPALKVGEVEAGVRRFLTDNGLADATLRLVQTGRNNRVWVVESSRGRSVLKKYRRSAADVRDRLATEYRFLELLNANGIEHVPEPIAYDGDLHMALYSFLPGTPIGEVTRDHICQSAEFVLRVDGLRAHPSALAIPAASEACFSIRDHLDSVRVRAEQLVTLSVESPLHEEVRRLARSGLLPALDRINATVMAGIDHDDLDRPLTDRDRILSPSDFGFHNVLESEGVLQFLDFEYAGWDDPAKLICDFVCQPDLPLDLELGQFFMRRLCMAIDSERVAERVELLLPLHRLKWCCILLNGFRGMEWSEPSSTGMVEVDVLRSQLLKASAYFDEHLARS
jgi:hypothetical protein